MAKRPAPHAIQEALNELLRARPFAPFDIKMADGDTIHVRRPDFIARTPSSSTATVYDRDEHFRIVHLDMVVTLEPTRASKGTFGSPGRR